MRSPPLPFSYWVQPGRFLAGPTPVSVSEEATRANLRRLLEAGVDFFLDLTEFGELPSYAALAAEEAGKIGAHILHRRMPIPDHSVVSPQEMHRRLQALDQALDAGHTVYLHCYGGLGRTGTVVGCWLVQQGWEGTKALEKLRELRAVSFASNFPSPETPEQVQMVLTWPPDSF